ncbi:MAG TPA: UDP-N-acetylmuramoyl-tripeptide--D-alanyl-D-alanine ligase [Acidisarcina sp.]|nr:UDP-N-acetylmuramoyl-tripeptide--D-alanyl-D-alanine ligase [Acidisarcina sp.]
MNLSLVQIAAWVDGTLLPQSAAGSWATGYSIDSRTLESGDLFFAIRGDRFDGHDFVRDALDRGARAAVISAARAEEFRDLDPDYTLLLVPSPLAALQMLAAAVRRHWAGRVIGVTGSAGKTTTKDAIAQVLGRRFRVLKSQGNLNNGFGLPLQLLRLQPEHQVAVIEMGMSHAGEIAELAHIAAPDWGVVTNVGSAHAENFRDGIAGIARAKFELIQALPPHGVAFLNCDDRYVSQFGRDFHGKAVYFGTGPSASPRAISIQEPGGVSLEFEVQTESHSAPVRLHLIGRHNVTNVLAAIAVGLESGIPLAECASAVSELQPGDKRGETLEIAGARIINDSYNSNPEALKSMIHALAAMPAQRRILVAGEMLELGPGGPEMHRECGAEAAAAGITMVLGVRGNARFLVEGARRAGAEALFVESPAEAGAWLRAELQPGDAVLLKASRGVRLEQALTALQSEKK